jgi:hypothetical protein
MQTKYTILLASIVLLAFAGCQKLTEDPKGTLTPEKYFKTQSDLDASVAAMYVRLARDGAWGFTSKETSYFGSDDLTTDPGLNKQDQRDFDRLAGGSTNGSLTAQWNGPWQAIYQANNILANYQNVNSDEDLKKDAAGQAHFIRGLCYYYLVRTFGQVPLILRNLDLSERPPRTSVDSIYVAIINDLDTAKSYLGTEIEPGKPNQYAASALLADVYLTMAGWPLKQTDHYALAAAEANTVIKAGVYNLNTPYDKVFTTNYSSESIFSLSYNVSGGLPNRSFGSTNVPLDEVAVDGSSGWDDVYPELTFFKNAPKCTRTDLTFYTTLKLRNPDNTTFTLVPWDSPKTHAQHPYYKKFRAGLNGDGVRETDDAIQSIQPSTNKATDIIRYPLVLLDFAEATAMAGSGPNKDAYDAINQVRKRAGEPPLTPGLSQLAFRDSVVYERAYEFAGEFGVRWFDIVRLQLLPDIIKVRSPKENPIAPGTDLSTRYLAPIPFPEMALNPDWDQNPGY